MTTSQLWTDFSGRLRGFIGKRIREENDVEDVLQDVFARIHSGLGRLKSSDRLEAWLFRVARSAVIDHLRRRSRRSAPLSEDLTQEVSEVDIGTEVSSWLRPMMEALSEEDREALRLADLEGLPQRELAARLGLSLTGAKSRIQRARLRLKEVLLQCCRIDVDRRGNAIGYTRRTGSCDSCSCS